MNLEDFQTEFERGAVMNEYRGLFRLSISVELPICLIGKFGLTGLAKLIETIMKLHSVIIVSILFKPSTKLVTNCFLSLINWIFKCLDFIIQTVRVIGGDKPIGYGNRRRSLILELPSLTIPCDSRLYPFFL